MNKLYLIMRGEYSNTECLGYCTTREKAEEYCAVKNVPNERGYWHEDYYVDEVECLDGTIQADVNVGELYTVGVGRTKRGGWEFSLWTLTHICRRVEPVVQTVDNGRRYRVKIWQPKGKADKSLIKKIAQDTFYQWLADQAAREADFQNGLKRYLTT